MPAGSPSRLVLAVLLAALGCASGGGVAGTSASDRPDAGTPASEARNAGTSASDRPDAGTPASEARNAGTSASDRPDATLLDMTAPAAARAGEEPEARKPTAAPAGNADQPGRLLIYSAITGHVPLDDPGAGADPGRSPAEREVVRAATLEAEIAGELEKQERLAVEERVRSEAPPPPEPAPEDPSRLEASAAPPDRELPERLFAVDRVTIARGEWQNANEFEVERRTLDADRDGRPEEVRYADPASGALVRVEQDLDYDGAIDAWKTYANGRLAVRVLDRDGDGRSDAWERYADGRLVQRTEDRDRDGVRDLFLRYQGPSLAERLEDANDDGTIDRVVLYEQKRRVRSEEDLSFNGSMDTWTTYAVVDGREVVASVRRDTRDEGKPDVFETYETTGGETRLARREEDLNRDGKVDVVSVYEQGRLVQRAISDEALAPL
jgi:hypothetical protein